MHCVLPGLFIRLEGGTTVEYIRQDGRELTIGVAFGVREDRVTFSHKFDSVEAELQWLTRYMTQNPEKTHATD